MRAGSRASMDQRQHRVHYGHSRLRRHSPQEVVGEEKLAKGVQRCGSDSAASDVETVIQLQSHLLPASLNLSFPRLAGLHAVCRSHPKLVLTYIRTYIDISILSICSCDNYLYISYDSSPACQISVLFLYSGSPLLFLDFHTALADTSRSFRSKWTSAYLHFLLHSHTNNAPSTAPRLTRDKEPLLTLISIC